MAELEDRAREAAMRQKTAFQANFDKLRGELQHEIKALNPLTPIVAIWQHTCFRHHNFIKKC